MFPHLEAWGKGAWCGKDAVRLSVNFCEISDFFSKQKGILYNRVV
jgi:hypothetical protein